MPRSPRGVFRIATLCLTAYWLAIFVGTHLPAQSMPDIRLSDKTSHFLAFAGLAFLLAWAIPVSRGRWLRHLVLVAVVAFGYCVLDEATQHFIPGRTCDVADMAADALGVVAGLTCYLALRPLFARLSHRVGSR